MLSDATTFEEPQTATNSTATEITIARGDGIGPEIMDATLRVLDAANAKLELSEIRIGESVYLDGNTAGIEPEAWETLRRTGVFLKAPITTPQGGGYKSLNVTIRKSLGLYANIRPCVAYDPFVPTKHPGMNVVVVRENEEDTYGGIEHQQTDEVAQCLKLISRPGCEKICRYAFEYARTNGREKVTCFTKDNIMKLTDGLFHQVFREVAERYPEIESDHMIVDIGTARLADTPDMFDVIVTPNLYGDIISDVAAQIAGSVGLAGSANIGRGSAMFEAIHGSAPPIAGKNVANPSGLLNSAVMMLVHVDQPEVAGLIHNAWLRTIEDGVRTFDIAGSGNADDMAGTAEFADAVIARLGEEPKKLPKVAYQHQARDTRAPLDLSPVEPREKKLVGVDVFVHDRMTTAPQLAERLQQLEDEAFHLKMITNRGVKVWPDGFPETFCTDHWRCRFLINESFADESSNMAVLLLLQAAAKAGVDVVKTENLYTFDGERSYSLGQGE